MTEMIWRATDLNGACWHWNKQPTLDGNEFNANADCMAYYGPEKPPPGECWEMVVTRKGDIDTDGDPIGWKIVGIGRDGSVLCEKPNGQRRRYSFGDGANWQPSGEALERLVDALRAKYRGDWDRVLEAFTAYEAAKPDEPKRPTCGTTAQQATIERLTKELDEAKAEVKRLKQFENLYSHAIDCVDRVFQIDSSKSPPILPNFARLGDCKFEAVVRLAKEYAALKNELANEQARSGQVTTAQINVIAELQEQIRKLKAESATQTDAISERDDRIDQLSGELQLMTRQRDELQARLDKPEMPECVREFIDAVCLEVPGLFAQKIAAVRDHYAPPFRIDKLGWYLASDGKEWRVAEIDGYTAWGRNGFVWYGFSTKRVASSLLQLTKYLRPLEG